jgi:hypothetical protein
MGIFKDSFPPSLANPNALAIVRVYDEANEHKRSILETYVRSYNPLTTKNANHLDRFLSDLGGLTLPNGMPIIVREQLILAAFQIHAYKGTPYGFRLFIEKLCQGDVLIDDGNLHSVGNYIQPDEVEEGYGILQLSEGALDVDIDADLDFYAAAVLDNGAVGFRFVFDADSYESAVPSFRVAIRTPFAHILEFRDYLVEVIVRYLCMSGINDNIEISLIGHLPTNNRLSNYVDIP